MRSHIKILVMFITAYHSIKYRLSLVDVIGNVSYTVNNKTYVGENFHDLLGSLIM